MASGTTSKSFMWGLMGLLILALGGFGATSLTGGITSVGSVGDADIDINSYANGLQEDIRAVEAQTGQALSFEQAVQFGIPQTTLSRLVGIAALDNEAANIGLSVGDDNLSRQILGIESFAGTDGNFDRESYRFVLERSGQSEADFEEQMRNDMVRGLIQGAVVTGLEMPASYTDLLVNYAAERRSFDWVTLDPATLETVIATPSDADLASFHADNAADFTQPEKKRLTYVWLSPDDLIDDVAVDEALIIQRYEDRSAEFNIPERRLVERLVLSDAASAEAARSRLDAGEVDYEALVTERGLALQDIDLGDVTQAQLGSAGDAVFAANVNDIVGPVETSLGPALLRVNGILPGQATTLEQARAQLRDELAADAARRQIATQSETAQDLLASGATLEELQTEANMVLAQLDWFDGADAPIAAYSDFRVAAANVTADDYPTVIELDDGGIAALRLESVLEAQLEPLADVRDAVEAAWREAATTQALADHAASLLTRLNAGEDFTALGLTAQSETDTLRSDFIPGTGPEFLTTVFGLNPGEAAVESYDNVVVLVQLNDVLSPDLSNEEVSGFVDRIAAQSNASIAQDLYADFSEALQDSAGLTLDRTAIEAVHANFQHR